MRDSVSGDLWKCGQATPSECERGLPKTNDLVSEKKVLEGAHAVDSKTPE